MLGNGNYAKGETFYLCRNCGTEMRYMPAGELLNSGGSKVKENNGWITGFSVRSSELYSSQAMFVLGILILIVTFLLLWLGKTGTDAALWSAGSGILLIIIGRRRIIRQNKKTELIFSKYPYWGK
jgi:hypothetical protein